MKELINRFRNIFRQSPLIVPFISIIVGVYIVELLYAKYGSEYMSHGVRLAIFMFGSVFFLISSFILWSMSKSCEPKDKSRSSYIYLLRRISRFSLPPIVVLLFAVSGGYLYGDYLYSYDQKISSLVFDSIYEVKATIVETPQSLANNKGIRGNGQKYHQIKAKINESRQIDSYSKSEDFHELFASKANIYSSKSAPMALLMVDTVLRFSTGDELVFSARIRMLPDNRYGQWLKREDYVCRLYVYPWSIDTIHRDRLRTHNPNLMEQLGLASLNLRNQMMFKLNRADTSGLASSLLLGQRQTLPKQLKNAYTQAGVAHIMAISGMHVAIIFGVITFFLGWFRLFNWGRKFVAVTTIVLLLLYLWIVGYPISATRAVIMFIAFQLAVILDKQSSSVNSLSLSGIIILLLWPQSVFDLGFQLSFIAVLSILIFYPRLSKLLNFKNPALRFTYQLFIVTLCAQIGVMPLIIYNFGMIPFWGLVLFLFLGLSVPLIIILGIVCIATEINIVSLSIGKVCSLQNQIILSLQELDNSYFEWLKNIEISYAHVWILYLLLSLLAILVVVTDRTEYLDN